MIIEEIRLVNFGVFGGTQVAHLTPPSKNKPIVLFGGLNGAGKTTLLEGIQLALYGRQAPFLESARGFDRYVSRCFHRRAKPDEGACVGLTIATSEDGVLRRYQIDRSWRGRNGRIEETLETRINGAKDEVLAETWLEHAERFIPARLAPLFFFDGERIEKLADPEHSSAVLRTAIDGLLGVDLIEQLRVDLQALAQRKRKLTKSSTEQGEIEVLERELEAKRSAIANLRQERAQVQNQRDRAAKRLRELENQFDARGGRLAEQRGVLQRSRDEAQVQLQVVQARLVAIAHGPLPMAMCRTLLADVAAQADAESIIERSKLQAAVAGERDVRLVDHLRGRKMDAKVIRVVEKFLAAEHMRFVEQCQGTVYLDLSSLERSQVQDLLDARFAQEQHIAATLLAEASNVQTALDDLDRKLAAAPDEEVLGELLQKVQHARDSLSELERKLSLLDLNIKQGAFETENVERRLEKALRTNRESALDNQDIERHLLHTEHTQVALERFRVSLIAKHQQKLRDLVLDGYVKLLHKQSLVTRVDVDPDTCTLRLFNDGGQSIPEDKLSAGERQLLAVAILWGLARASGRPLPTVIDTPLGRLDAVHRRNLIERYFPYASHQVVLLSTDEEIDQRYFKALDGRIGRAYNLKYDDETESSSIEPGYFW